MYYADGNVAIGLTNPSYPLHVSGEAGRTVYVHNGGSSGYRYGLFAKCDSTTGRALYGTADASTGSAIGVYGRSYSSSGKALYGYASSSTGANYAVQGVTASDDGYAGYFQGGRNYFEGNVGIRESDPLYPLHIEGSFYRGIFVDSAETSGTRYGIWAESDSSSGVGIYGKATADTGTTYGVFGRSESNAGTAVYGYASSTSGFNKAVRGKTSSVLGYAGYFEGGRNYFEGDVGIGEPDPSYPLHVLTGGGNGIYVETTAPLYGRGIQAKVDASSGVAVEGEARAETGFATGVLGISRSPGGNGVRGAATSETGSNVGVYGLSSSPNGYDFYAGGAGTNYGASSSIRWKRNVHNIDRPLDKIARLRGVYFDWDAEHGGYHDVGMIAEEVGAVLPEIVQYEANGVDASGMDYSKLTPLLVEALNALRAEKDAEIAARDRRIESLERSNAELEARLARLESLVSELTQRQGVEP
jgi:hypothetical protein